MSEKYMKGTVALLKSGSTGTEFVAMYSGKIWTLDGSEDTYVTLEELLRGETFEVAGFLRGGPDKEYILEDLDIGTALVEGEYDDLLVKKSNGDWLTMQYYGERRISKNSLKLALSGKNYRIVKLKELW